MDQEPIINGYLRQMLSLGGSDLHLSVNFPAKARIHGNIHCLDVNLLVGRMRKVFGFKEFRNAF